MNKIKVNIKICIDFYNELFIGGGKGNSDIDLYVLKDVNGMPYIPGSTLKGKLRYMTTLVNNIFKQNNNSCKRNEGKRCNCLVCDLFGDKDNKKGKLNFSNLSLNSDSSEDLIHIRNGIAVNRYLGTVYDKSFFKFESIQNRNNYFKGEINGYLSEDNYKKQLLLLFLGFSLIETFGGFQSRGLGWLGETKEMKIYVNNREITRADLNEWRNELEV